METCVGFYFKNFLFDKFLLHECQLPHIPTKSTSFLGRFQVNPILLLRLFPFCGTKTAPGKT